ncbi:hypothetical protein C8R46DRAFT_1325848 [Mycena filopes]|nr:hypothetical protein C8R46DRAFT_1325848 [Mycena filopes]
MSTDTSTPTHQPEGPLPVPLGVNGIPDERYQRLLNSNEAPLDFECPFIQFVLSTRRDRLARYDDTGLRPPSEAGNVETHEALVADVARNAAILSPLRWMPVEILSEIFSWTLPSDWELLQRGRIDVRDSPWTLSQTCSRWRTIAIHSPSLWSFIGIYCGYENLAVIHPLELLKTQLERASHLRIHFTADYLSAHSEHLLALFKLFVKHSAMWVDVNLTLATELVPTLTSIPSDGLPLLRNLWLKWTPDSEPLDQEARIDCFINARALRSVKLRSEEWHVRLPSHQLTRYEATSSWDCHLQILQNAPNLIEARIYVPEEEENPRVIPDGSILELRSLKLLDLSHSDIMNCLRVPALRELSLSDADEATPRHIDSMVLRSSCILEALRVVNVAATVVTTILQNHRDITKFVYVATESEEDANPVVSALSACDGRGAATLAPQLADAKFFVVRDSYFDYTQCLEMFSLRWKTSVRHLKSAGLVIERDPWAPELSSSVLKRSDELREELGSNLLFEEVEDALEQERLLNSTDSESPTFVFY